MSKIEVNEIVKASGSTLTLGGCGTAVTLGSGATQSGFGRTGTVDWQTGDIKTGNFTAENGKGYFVDVSSGAITVTLPASPSAGDIVAISDYAGNSANNNITVARNGSKIEGLTEDGAIITNRQSGTFVYVDSTQGWLVVNSNDASFKTPEFVAATGGTVTTVCTNFKVHTFNSPGNFIVSNGGNNVGSNSVQTLIVAGGGGGGRGCSHGSGGGAGGFRTTSATPVSAQTYPIVVGAGGTGAPAPTKGSGTKGSDSSGFSITSTGGGFGSGWNDGNGGPGGSGGGSANNSSPENYGTGNTPPVSPSQGFPGGIASGARMGGGGGASEAGNTDGPTTSGEGGDGSPSTITGSDVTYAGGGAGGGSSSPGCVPGGAGGGGSASPSPGTGGSGTANLGGGGAGSYTSQAGGAGGSGVVIIRYKFQ